MPRSLVSATSSQGRLRLAPLLLLVLSVGLFGLALEGAVRFLLFAETADAWPIALRLRQSWRFARGPSDELYHVLHYKWLPPERRATRPGWAPHHDARVGWTSDRFEPGDYRHAHEDRIGDRRLVLLFGDSFSAGAAGSESAFEALLERSPSGKELALLNYGVPGFGIDQVYLLLGPVLDRFAEVRPVVVVGILVDDDLDRAILRFRDWPKPRLLVEDGELIVPTGAVPTAEAFLADHPVPRAWYSLRLAERKLGRSSVDEHAAETQELAPAILRAMVQELRGRGLDFAFLLFHGPEATVDAERGGWRLRLVREELAALSAPWVEARAEICATAAREGREIESYFWADGHLNAEGNAAAFPALLGAVEVAVR